MNLQTVSFVLRSAIQDHMAGISSERHRAADPELAEFGTRTVISAQNCQLRQVLGGQCIRED